MSTRPRNAANLSALIRRKPELPHPPCMRALRQPSPRAASSSLLNRIRVVMWKRHFLRSLQNFGKMSRRRPQIAPSPQPPMKNHDVESKRRIIIARIPDGTPSAAGTRHLATRRPRSRFMLTTIPMDSIVWAVVFADQTSNTRSASFELETRLGATSASRATRST